MRIREHFKLKPLAEGEIASVDTLDDGTLVVNLQLVNLHTGFHVYLTPDELALINAVAERV